MQEAYNLSYLTGVSKLCGSRHPSLRPGRFRYFEQVKAPLTSGRRVDIPRLKAAVLSLKDESVILRLLD
jgi:hypothetical protein